MSETLSTEHERTQAELENLYDYIADGAILRSKGRFPLGGIFRAEWYFLLSFDAHSPPIGL